MNLKEEGHTDTNFANFESTRGSTMVGAEGPKIFWNSNNISLIALDRINS